jgi:hypothetical protein
VPGGTGPGGTAAAPAERVDPAVADLVQRLEPFPTLVKGRRWDVLAANPAARELFTDWAAEPAGERNLVRWMFTTDRAREVYLEWEPEARAMLGRFRLAAARHPDDPGFAELIAALRRDSEQARDWWPRHDVQAVGSGTKKLRHPRLGPVEYAHVVLQVADDPEQTIVTYSPAAGPARLPGRSAEDPAVLGPRALRLAGLPAVGLVLVQDLGRVPGDLGQFRLQLPDFAGTPDGRAEAMVRDRGDHKEPRVGRVNPLLQPVGSLHALSFYVRPDPARAPWRRAGDVAMGTRDPRRGGPFRTVGEECMQCDDRPHDHVSGGQRLSRKDNAIFLRGHSCSR